MHLGKKRYFLPLGTTPKTGVGFITKKITAMTALELVINKFITEF